MPHQGFSGNDIEANAVYAGVCPGKVLVNDIF